MKSCCAYVANLLSRDSDLEQTSANWMESALTATAAITTSIHFPRATAEPSASLEDNAICTV